MEDLQEHGRRFVVGTDIKDLEHQITKFLQFCTNINLKLAPWKFKINPTVKFLGMLVSSEKLKQKWINALTEIPKSKTKREVQIACGMLAELQNWFPSISYSVPNLRKQCAHQKTFEWSEACDIEWVNIKEIFKKEF